MRRRQLAAIGLLLAASGLVRAQPVPDPARYNGFQVGGALVPLDAIERGGPPRDGIPAIDSPRFVTPDQAGLRDNDRVLGLQHRGVTRAYPVRILNWHEVVNDRLAGDPVAVTYCPLCGTGMALATRLGLGLAARDLMMGVSGLLYNSDVLLYDRQTQSLWSQLMQTAISGPLKGSKLAALPLEHTTWADWRARHPATEVLSTETGFARDYDRDPYAGYAAVSALMFKVQHEDARLPAKTWVMGISLNGASKAYPFPALARRVGPDGWLSDTVGGQPVRIRFDAAHQSARVTDAKGAPVPSVTAFWFAWIAFHPRSTVLD